MKSKGNTQFFNKAKDYAFRLLKFRIRSEAELYQRLKRKKFDEHTIEKVILFLKDKEFINDQQFARLWVEDKIKRPLGLRRIREELKRKGIDKKIIEEVLTEAQSNYNEESIVLELAKRRLERLKNLDPRKARTRLYAYLLRRGFSPDSILDVIIQLQKDSSKDE